VVVSPVGRVAVLSDIHGVMPALAAVLAEPDLMAADLIVLTGDLAAGPQPAETLDRLVALGDRAVWIRGNADRELVEFARDLVSAADPLQHPLGDGRVEQRPSRGDLAHRVDQRRTRDLLEHVPSRTRHNRCEQRVVIVVRRQDQDVDRRVDRTHRAAHLDATAVRQPTVQNGDVRMQCRNAAGCLYRGCRLPHHHHVFGLEEIAKSTAYDLMVV